MLSLIWSAYPLLHWKSKLHFWQLVLFMTNRSKFHFLKTLPWLNHSAKMIWYALKDQTELTHQKRAKTCWPTPRRLSWEIWWKLRSNHCCIYTFLWFSHGNFSWDKSFHNFPIFILLTFEILNALFFPFYYSSFGLNSVEKVKS